MAEGTHGTEPSTWRSVPLTAEACTLVIASTRKWAQQRHRGGGHVARGAGWGLAENKLGMYPNRSRQMSSERAPRRSGGGARACVASDATGGAGGGGGGGGGGSGSGAGGPGAGPAPRLEGGPGSLATPHVAPQTPVTAGDPSVPQAFTCPASGCALDCQQHPPVRLPCSCRRLVCRKCAGALAAKPPGGPCALCSAPCTDPFTPHDCPPDPGVLLALAGRLEASQPPYVAQCSTVYAGVV